MALKFKIPNQVRATSKVTYEVVYTDEFKDPKVVGECRPEVRQIAIKRDLKNTELFKTFLHEVIHMAAMENDLVLTENQVVGLENSLYKVLKLNGWLK